MINVQRNSTSVLSTSLWWLTLLTPAVWLGLSGCKPEAAPAPVAATPLKLTATIQDLMAAEVDPAADFLWAAVGSVVSETGTEEQRPSTDEEWKLARHQAIILIEATHLLVMEGRRVAAPGAKLEDHETPGILTPEESQQAIDTNRATFVAFAQSLHEIGTRSLAAIDARDPQALMNAGDDMEPICEGCHMKFWYPNQVIPGSTGLHDAAAPTPPADGAGSAPAAKP